jgi:uncharacterized protein (DUF1499 family)
VAPGDLLAAVRRTVEKVPRWSVGSAADHEIKAVLRTRLLRFRDDVSVRVTDHEGGTRAEFRSASRVGKGDLGQNPRNLRELIEALKRELPVG